MSCILIKEIKGCDKLKKKVVIVSVEFLLILRWKLNGLENC